MPHRGGVVYGAMQMNDEDDDMLFSVLFVALTVAVVLFVVGGIGVVLWSVFL
jgi:flagellar basal body-associated protein FliL